MAHFSAFATVTESLSSMGASCVECDERLQNIIDSVAVEAVRAAEMYYEELSCEYYFGENLETME